MPSPDTHMPMKWTSKALGDLVRLHAFLADNNPKAAATVVQAPTKGAEAVGANLAAPHAD